MSLKGYTTNPDVIKEETSLRGRVKHYKKRMQEIEKYLEKNPTEWGKFQNEFNSEVNAVFREIMIFEKDNILVGNEDKVYKLKRIFTDRIKSVFIRGTYMNWALRKPYGYAGDFKIIEDIYENNPITQGVERLFDNYYMMSSICIAVRNRKNDFKRMLIEYVSNNQNKPVRIMNLASGPCREVFEICIEKKDLFKNVIFDCYDSDEHALEYAKKRLAAFKNVNFFSLNAARIAFRKDVNELIKQKYDIIYSTGLFDYFEERIAFRLIQNLKKLLSKNGQLFISDVRDKYSNPSVHFMEWVAEWELVYREDDNFRKLFIDADFAQDQIIPLYEQQGILQYILAENRRKK